MSSQKKRVNEYLSRNHLPLTHFKGEKYFRFAKIFLYTIGSQDLEYDLSVCCLSGQQREYYRKLVLYLIGLP